MPLQGGLSVERMFQLSEVSQASFYRYLRRGWQAEEEMTLRSAVQNIVVQHRWCYGYRRVAAELRAQGMFVNQERIARIMREDNLLAVRNRWFRPPEYSLCTARIHLNLAGRMTLSGPNQLWAADITYVRLAGEFVYLAVILDVFSRKVIGWALERNLKAQLPLSALERAVANRKPPLGVVHHSDQGAQAACRDYKDRLRHYRMLPSMSRPANPYDNATCESFLKTLKREEIHAGTYRDLEDLRERVEEFIERYYNRSRLHSALRYSSPEEFEKEAQAKVGGSSAAAIVTFFGG
jgi:transposase InsO family protein